MIVAAHCPQGIALVAEGIAAVLLNAGIHDDRNARIEQNELSDIIVVVRFCVVAALECKEHSDTVIRDLTGNGDL